MSYKYLFLLCFSFSIYADDSQTNPLAKKIKAQVVKSMKGKSFVYNGYCDLTIEMVHSHNQAKVKRVSSSGDSHVCKDAKKGVKLGKSYRYEYPEKFIRLHITP
ncbi:MAG: hypothetical protein ACPG5L_15060 [Vibrio gallaecicus]